MHVVVVLIVSVVVVIVVVVCVDMNVLVIIILLMHVVQCAYCDCHVLSVNGFHVWFLLMIAC